MKWIKKNKFTVAAIFIFILITFLGFKIIETFFPDQRAAIYGDRLEGKVNVDEKVYEEVKKKISENKVVENITLRENGRRVDITIKVTNAAGKNESKKLIDNILDSSTLAMNKVCVPKSTSCSTVAAIYALV